MFLQIAISFYIVVFGVILVLKASSTFAVGHPDKMSSLGPDTSCFKFLYVVHLTHILSNGSQGISKFCVTCRVDKTWQEAESWASKPDSSGIWYRQVAHCQIWLSYFLWYLQVCQSHNALWEPWMPQELLCSVPKGKNKAMFNKCLLSIHPLCGPLIWLIQGVLIRLNMVHFVLKLTK